MFGRRLVLMLLTSKQIAYLGLLVAISTILVTLSGIIETNTLFFLVAASFGVGLAVRETNLRMGVAFLVASIVLSFILAPNKVYCLTYSFLGVYLLGTEFIFEYIAKSDFIHQKKRIFWLLKAAFFNSMYVPIVFFFPSILFGVQNKEQAPMMTVLILLVGQIFLIIYDVAYHYFQRNFKLKIQK